MYGPEEHPLPRSQSGVLALILRLVARDGYGWYSVQYAPEDRILVALSKIHAKNPVLMDGMSRHLRRKAGLPAAMVILAPEPKGGRWPLALLATQDLKGENMNRVDAKHPLTWPAWREGKWQPTYVLRRDPNRQRWTWYLEEAFYRALLEEALLLARMEDWGRLREHLRRVGTLPLFHGIWEQAHEIRRRVHRLWGDRHRRGPGGEWKRPPWGGALEGWPQRPFSLNVPVWRDEPPRTVGEWLEMRREG
ncbi:MAG: hypothetical protein ACK4G4_10160 [Thermus sp.]|uniref:hypothetical protein n=1 Tax=Thermus sp. TaxID=275 RepID=UPI00391B2FFB